MKRHVVRQGHRVDAGVDSSCGQQGGQRRCEPHGVRVLGDVHRLDPEPVTREDDPVVVLFDDGHGEHADEGLLDKGLTPFGIGLITTSESPWEKNRWPLAVSSSRSSR